MNISENEAQLTFEDAISELKEIVQSLEAGNTSLNEATTLFEKGMVLANICNDRLTKAELKVTTLQAEFEQQIQLLQDLENSGN
mgnify:CR=1 FL=1|tara:strand:+ start:6281 stop:6532 length:252 start_codon:yes stop_codon:yes gene_type:complete